MQDFNANYIIHESWVHSLNIMYQQKYVIREVEWVKNWTIDMWFIFRIDPNMNRLF